MATRNHGIIIHSDEVQNFNNCIRVLAGPGAGKTFWITRQIRQILQSGILGSTRKVACITYTNKAVQNIEENVGNSCSSLEVSTIHAFLYAHVIKPYFHLIADEYNFAIEKLDGHDEDTIMGYNTLQNCMPAKKKFLLSGFKKYSELKNFIEKHSWQLNKGTIRLHSFDNNHSPLPGFKIDEVKLYKKYIWREYGVMYHDDVLFFAYQLINKYTPILDFIVAKFPYILIDEYQDTNSIQHYIFQKLAASGAKVTIIGDKVQSIYGFAGGDIKNITSFNAPDMKEYTIGDNRRSTSSIVQFLNILRGDIQQQALRSEDFGAPVILIGEAKDNYISAKHSCGSEKLVSLSWNNRTANSLRLELSISKKKDLLDKLYDSRNERTKFVYNCLLGIESARSMQMKDALRYIMAAFKLEKKNLKDKQKAFQYLQIISLQDADYRQGSLSDFYDVIRPLSNENLPRLTKGKDATLFSNSYLDFARCVQNTDEDADHLTIHKSKGIEFDNVILVFTNTSDALDFLLRTDLTQEKDDHRLYYVACSRARQRLFISIPSLSKDEMSYIKKRFNDLLTIKCDT